jgi:hypothetical protein
MKHGIIILPVMGLQLGHTVDIITETCLYYMVKPYGETNQIGVSRDCLQIAEDIYDYTNPVIVNK